MPEQNEKSENASISAAFARIEAALSALRISPGCAEDALHEAISGALTDAGLSFTHEARLAPRCRVDFFIEIEKEKEGIALEVKRGRPQRTPLLAQLRRYAAPEAVRGVILVVERSANIPSILCGKPCWVFGLNRLWGVALK